MTTSVYREYGTLPTLTEKEKEDLLSAKELPKVDSTDNGKALIVVNGAWAKAAIPQYELQEAGAEKLGGVLQAENVAASEATSVASLKGTVNDLLAALKAAGIMAADPEEEQAET